MSIKILHSADFHLDSPFEALPAELAAVRRSEQRALIDRLVELANAEGVQLVLLAGDLLDSAASYYETQDVLVRAFSRLNAHVFIAPGNHDYYCPKSPYASILFPENVHIFTSPLISCVKLPELGCRVWGAAFNDPYSRPLLPGFKAPDDGLIDLMVLHGDLSGDAYNRVRESEIAASGLDYLALGHIHTFSGLQKAGSTSYAYSGCPEGRGFDETGEKGVILGTVSETGCDLQFRPLGGRRYEIHTVDLTGVLDPDVAIDAALPADTSRDICRLVLTGEFDGTLDLNTIKDRLSGRFFQLTLTDQTRPPVEIWSALGDDTLEGLFLRSLKEKYDSAETEDVKNAVLLAVRYGLAALRGGEEYAV